MPAALVELEETGDPGRAAMATVLGQSGGSAAGPLVAGLLAQWAPAPRQLCYLVGIVATVVVAAGVWRIPEPREEPGEWRLQKPSVPPEIRTGFAAREPHMRLRLGGGGALFLSVVPSYAAELLETSNLALLGAISATMLAMDCGRRRSACAAR